MKIMTLENEQFLNHLYAFHQSKGTSFNHYPELNGYQIDLNRILQLVRSYGGIDKVNDRGLWISIANEFGVGSNCVNGSAAIKYLYQRYLQSFDRTIYAAVAGDTSMVNDEDDDIRKKGIPVVHKFHSQMYQKYLYIDSNRRTLGLRKLNDSKCFTFEKLKLSLLSGFSNELLFVLNSLLLISNDGNRFGFRLSTYPILLEMLLARVGLMYKDSEFFTLYKDWWQPVTGFSFLKYWYEIVGNETIQQEFLSPISKFCKRLLRYKTMFNISEPCNKSAEDLIIEKVATILNNLSNNENNVKLLSQQDICWRFLILCIYSNRDVLRHTSLNCCVSLCSVLRVRHMDDITQKCFKNMIIMLLHAEDRYNINSGLSMLSNLCGSNQETRSWMLIEINLNTVFLSQTVKFLTFPDVLIVLSALEYFYQLTNSFQDNRDSLLELDQAVNYLIDSSRFVKLMCCFISSGANCLQPGSYDHIKIIEESSISDDNIEKVNSQTIQSSLRIIDPNNTIMQWIRSNLEVNSFHCIRMDEFYYTFQHIVVGNDNKLLRAFQYLPFIIQQCFPSAVFDDNKRIIIGLSYIASGSSTYADQEQILKNLKRPYSPRINEGSKRIRYHEKSGEMENSSSIPQYNQKASSEASIERVVNFGRMVESDIADLLNKMVFEVSCRLATNNQVASSSEMRCFLQQHFISLVGKSNTQTPETDEYNVRKVHKSMISEWYQSLRINIPLSSTVLEDEIQLSTRHVIQIMINQLELEIADNPALAGDYSCRDAASRLQSLILILNPSVRLSQENILAGLTPPAIKCTDATGHNIVESTVQKIFNRSATSCDQHDDRNGKHICEWQSCYRLFPTMQSMLIHVCGEHIQKGDEEICCFWSRCDSSIRRKKWAMISHLQDLHCCVQTNESTQHSNLMGNGSSTSTNMAYSARKTIKSDGPVSRSIKLLGSLVCRNMSKCSSRARRLLASNQDIFTQYAMESNEASKIISSLLSEIYLL